MDLSSLEILTIGAALKTVFTNFIPPESEANDDFEETRSAKWFRLKSLVLQISGHYLITTEQKNLILNEASKDFIEELARRMHNRAVEVLDIKRSLKSDLEVCIRALSEGFERELKYQENVKRRQEELEEKRRQEELEERRRNAEIEREERRRQEDREERRRSQCCLTV